VVVFVVSDGEGDAVEGGDGEGDAVEEGDGEGDAVEEGDGDDPEEGQEGMAADEAGDGPAPAEDTDGNGVGLPIDQLMADLQNFEEFQQDEKQKRLLSEQFDGYLGAMERYYNQYIFIKKGSYRVGAETDEEDALTEQKVLMSDYYMGKYPVTNALFEVFVERTGYKTTAEKLGYGYVYHGRFRKVVDPNTGFTSSIWNSTYTREKVDGACWYQPIGPGSTLHRKRNHPVVQVGIQDARTFAAWTGKRLPSEIEWEAAARTRAGFRYPWGNEWIEGFCNFENSGISDTCPVDHNPHGVNEEGLADLLGNVMEWTSDQCDPKYPLETPAKFYVAKGGSWNSPEQTTLYTRSRIAADFTSNILGFRCLAD
jgi:formylglycine-generating enzyme required for sulfatase activity